jgi:hypothetical protein
MAWHARGQEFRVQQDGDYLAGEVPAGCDLLVADPNHAIDRHPAGDLGGANRDGLEGLRGRDRE